MPSSPRPSRVLVRAPTLADRFAARLAEEAPPPEVVAWLERRPTYAGPTIADLPALVGTTQERCATCGMPLPAREAGKAGRPKECCDARCTRIRWLREETEKLLAEIQDTATPQAWLDIRSRLWTALNARPWNRGVRRRA